MNFDEEARNLARAIARVLADGPAQKRLRGVEPPVAMVARDAVVGEIRMLSRILRANADRHLAATDPLHVDLSHMHNALSALPVACREGLSLSEALAVGGGPYCQRWQTAARAALQLELYHDVLRGPRAQGAMIGLAHLASTVSSLDSDLRVVLPGRSELRAGFASQSVYEQLNRACGNVLSHTAEPAFTESVARPFIPRVLPVRSLAAVPVAMRHLAELVERRGENITAHEIRAVARALLAGTDLAARESPGLAVAFGPIQALITRPMATLTAPSSRLLSLAAEIRGAINQGVVRPASGFAATWTEPARATAAALQNSLLQAGKAGRLLRPTPAIPSDDGQRLLWVQIDIHQTTGLGKLVSAAAQAQKIDKAPSIESFVHRHYSVARGCGISRTS